VSGSPKSAATWSAVVHAVTLVFGRSVMTAVLGCVGVLAAAELYFAAARGAGARRALLACALFSAASSVASVAAGIVVLAGVDVECVAADNKDACTLLQAVDGILLFAATSSASFFAAATAALAYLGSPEARASADDWKLDL